MKTDGEFERVENAICHAKELAGKSGVAGSAQPGKATTAVNAVGSATTSGQLGITMFFCILLGFLLGMGLDKLCGTAPGLMLAFTALGAASAFKVLFDYVRKG